MNCLTPAQVAARLQVDVGTVYGWITSGQLVGANIGGGQQRKCWRITEEDLSAFVSSRRMVRPAQRVRRRCAVPDYLG